MDAARRWQVASLATAVAGLGVGGLLIGRPAVDQVDPIDLDHVMRSSITPPGAGDDATTPGVPEIVEAEVEADADDTTMTPATSTSVASPEEPSSDATTDAPPPPPTTRTIQTPPAGTSPSTGGAADSDSVDSPGSVDSDSSVDS